MRRSDMIDALLDSAKVIGAVILVFILMQIACACTSSYRCPAYGQQQISRNR